MSFYVQHFDRLVVFTVGFCFGVAWTWQPALWIGLAIAFVWGFLKPDELSIFNRRKS